MNFYLLSIVLGLLLLAYASYQIYGFLQPVELGTEHVFPLCGGNRCSVIPLQLLFQHYKPVIREVVVGNRTEEAKPGSNIFHYNNETYILLLDSDYRLITDSTLAMVLNTEVSEDAFYSIINYTIVPLIAGLFWMLFTLLFVKPRVRRR